MAMDGEELLESAANGNSIDLEHWPLVLETVFSRLDYIIKDEFPPLRIPQPEPPPPPLFGQALSKADDAPSSQSSSSTNKENSAPARPPVPPFSVSEPGNATATGTIDEEDATSIVLPPPILELHISIRATLTKSFQNRPPHTIQRLAELIMYPTQHYRYLPSYLRAVDRIVCVSSGADIFPLPQATLPRDGPLINGMLNGQPTPTLSNLGSDESLGGALLTPIPWLKPDRIIDDTVSPTQAHALNQLQGQPAQGQNELKSEETEMVEGPNGVGRIETVSVVNGVLSSFNPVSHAAVDLNAGASTAAAAAAAAAALRSQAGEGQNVPAATGGGAVSVEESLLEAGAITQGELIRLEQEAGVVPVSVASRSPIRHRMQPGMEAGEGHGQPLVGDMGISLVDDDEEGEGAVDESPHARGPAEIGAEDVGPGLEKLRNSAMLDTERAVGRSADADADVDRSAGAVESAGDAEQVTATEPGGVQDTDVDMEDEPESRS